MQRTVARCPRPRGPSAPEPGCHMVPGTAGRGVMAVGGRGPRTKGKLFAKAVWGEEALYKPRASGLETSVSLQISEETAAPPECLNHVAAGEEQALAWRLQTHSPVLSGTWSCRGLWGSVPALTPCQIREKLSRPINVSVSFSHPCCEGSGVLDGTSSSFLSVHPPPVSTAPGG